MSERGQKMTTLETVLDTLNEKVIDTVRGAINLGSRFLTEEPRLMARIVKGADTMLLDQLLFALRDALHNELQLGADGHWTFDHNRAIALRQGLAAATSPGFKDIWDAHRASVNTETE